MKTIKNMRELELMKENLRYQQLLSEKKLINTSSAIVDTFTGEIKSWVFEWGTSLALQLIFGKKKDESSSPNASRN